MDNGKGCKSDSNGIHIFTVSPDQQKRDYRDVEPDENLLTHPVRQRPKSGHDTPFPTFHCVEFMGEEEPHRQVVENLERQDNNNTAIATAPHTEITGNTTQY